MKKIKDIFLNRFLKNKWIWIPSLIVIIFGVIFLFSSGNNPENIVTEIVKYTDIKQTVLATGQVTSSTDLDLSFNTNGVVKTINVKVGDSVKAGQVLATLDQSSVLANLTSAKGALAAANARYKRILEGATNEEISLAQITLDQTKLTQDILVKNAYKNLLNSNPEAVPEDEDVDYIAPIISGNYNLGKEGKIFLSSYSSSGGTSFKTTGLVEATGPVSSITPQPIGNSGLFINFVAGSDIGGDWVIEIPNKKAPNYLTNYNAYQATLSQAQSLIDQRTAELAIKKSSARQSDIDLAKADIISAEGQVQQANAKYNDTIIRAPLDGTITSIDIKPGELASALKEVIVLQDVSNIYLEANINEANIASLKTDMPVEITYDAFGSEKVFNGKITKIDPSSNIVSGVVNYKVTASVDKIEGLRPGMTANMTIKVQDKNNVIAVPSRSILTDKSGNKTIRLITNTKTKKFTEINISTGIEGDGGMTEIVDGLKENDEFVILIKD